MGQSIDLHLIWLQINHLGGLRVALSNKELDVPVMSVGSPSGALSAKNGPAITFVKCNHGRIPRYSGYSPAPNCVCSADVDIEFYGCADWIRA